MKAFILSITETADRDSFIAYMESIGIEYEEFTSLKTYFYVSDGFSHPDIQTFNRSDAPVKPAARAELTLDEDYNGGWNLARITRRNKPYNRIRSLEGVETFFDSVRTGLGVDIYVLDSGVREDNFSLVGRVTVVSGTIDNYGHGTACAALAAGETVGPATGAHVFSYKCLNDEGSGSISSITTAMDNAITHYLSRAATNRPAVMNLSLSSSSNDLNAAVASCVAVGIVVVAAAGNDSKNLDTQNVYPAKSPGAICVGGSNVVDGPYFHGASGSNYSADIVTVVAPSQYVRTVVHDNNGAYKHGRGTSYGCAMTTGVVACMLEGRGRLANADDVASVSAELVYRSTKGQLKDGPGIPAGTLPDRLLYLDPYGLTGHSLYGGIGASGEVAANMEPPPRTKHTYWRVRRVAQENANVNYSGLNELAFGTGVPTGGTAIASSEDLPTYPATLAFDGDSATGWRSASTKAMNAWIGYHFPTAFLPDEFSVSRNTSSSNYTPTEFAVEYSDDGITWAVDWVQTTDPWTSGDVVPRVFTRPKILAGSARRHWRVFIEDGDGDVNFIVIGEAEFANVLGVPMDGSDLTGPGMGTVSASSAASGNDADYAFNNTYNTAGTTAVGRYWSAGGGVENKAQWLAWDFGAGNEKLINQVRILCDRLVGRAPRNMRIEASEDGLAWITEWIIPPQTGWTLGEWRTFTRP